MSDSNLIPLVHESSGRRFLLIISALVGGFSILASMFFAVGGAGIYGGPFQGDAWHDGLLWCALSFGPALILPGVLLEKWKPGWGGMMLCNLTFVESGVIALLNVRQWGFAIHDAGLATLCLAAPLFLVGSLFLLTLRPKSRNWLGLWRVEACLAVVIGAYYLVWVGGDGLDALFVFLRGGTI